MRIREQISCHKSSRRLSGAYPSPSCGRAIDQRGERLPTSVRNDSHAAMPASGARALAGCEART